MVESPAEKNKSCSFRDTKTLGLIDNERINSQEQSLREREIKKGRRNEGEEMRNKSNGVKKGQKV